MAELGIDQLMGLGVGLVIAGIVIAIGAQITGNLRDDFGESSCASRTDGFTRFSLTAQQCQNSTNSLRPVSDAAFNVSKESLEGQVNITERFPTIGLVAGAIVIIGLLVGGFAYFKSS